MEIVQDPNMLRLNGTIHRMSVMLCFLFTLTQKPDAFIDIHDIHSFNNITLALLGLQKSLLD